MIKRMLSIVFVFAVLMTYTAGVVGLSYKYDDNGRLTEATYNSGQRLTYIYDSAGNITSFKNDPGKDILTGISLDSAAYTLEVGENHDTIVYVQAIGGSVGAISEGVTYTLSDVTVAQVDVNGRVTGLKPGATTLTVTLETFSVTANITVIEAADIISPTRVVNLRATGKTATKIYLAWDPSIDNKAVKGYYIYRDNVKVATVSRSPYTNSNLIPGKTYEYYIVAYDAAANVSIESVSIFETTTPDNELPTTPQNIIASNVTERSITITWDAVMDNISLKNYEIYLNGVKNRTINPATNTTTVSSIYTGLSPNKTYSFYVKALDLAGNYSMDSDTVTETTIADTDIPTVPTDIGTSSVGQRSVSLIWSPSTDLVGVAGYYVYRNDVKVATINKTQWANTDLIPGKDYKYYIKAYDFGGNISAASSSLVVTTVSDTVLPASPTDLMATEISETSIALAWNQSFDAVGMKGYEVYRDNVKIAFINKASYTNVGLIPGKSYVYTIKAYDVAGNVCEGSNSLTVTTLPDPIAPSTPIGLACPTYTERNITLTWGASTDNVGVKGYTIYRDGVKVTSTTATTYTNINLIPGKTYSYTVVAYDAVSNFSVLTDPLLVTTVPDLIAPSIVSNLNATKTETQVALTWTAATDNLLVSGYEIFRDGLKIAATSKTTYTNTGLIPGKVYSYAIKAYDIPGNRGDLCEAITATTVPDLEAPSVPEGLAGSEITETQLTLNWLQASDNIRIKGYELYKNGVKLVSTSLLTYTNKGITPGGTYTYTIVSYDVAGNRSANSNPVIVTTVPDTQAPTVPQELTATAISTNSVALKWLISTDNVAIKTYNIFRDGVKLTSTAALKYTNTGLVVGRTYKYKVQAVDSVGNVSDFCDEVIITVQ